VTSVEEISNSDIFLWALAAHGGSDHFVDVEDVFLACFELAPQRFAWRTKPHLPDYKKCSKALRDAEARRPPLLVKTGDGLGRQLSVDGQIWLQLNSDRLRTLLGGGRVIQEPKKRPRSRMLAEAETSGVYDEWLSSGTVPNEKWRVAELLRCSPDSPPATWKARLESLRGVAYSAGHSELLDMLSRIRSTHPSWFGEGALNEG
jgi:hypothetical protein